MKARQGNHQGLAMSFGGWYLPSQTSALPVARRKLRWSDQSSDCKQGKSRNPENLAHHQCNSESTFCWFFNFVYSNRLSTTKGAVGQSPDALN